MNFKRIIYKFKKHIYKPKPSGAKKTTPKLRKPKPTPEPLNWNLAEALTGTEIGIAIFEIVGLSVLSDIKKQEATIRQKSIWNIWSIYEEALK